MNRYKSPHMMPHDDGEFILFADHEAALAEAVQREREAAIDIINAYSTVCDRWADMLKAIRARSKP